MLRKKKAEDITEDNCKYGKEKRDDTSSQENRLILHEAVEILRLLKVVERFAKLYIATSFSAIMRCKTGSKYSLLEKTLTPVDDLLYALVARFRRKPNVPATILVLRYDGIGDVVSILPALEILRKTYSSAEIHVLVRSATATLLEQNPSLDKILLFDNDWCVYEKNVTMAAKIAGFASTLFSSFPAFLRLLRQGKYDLIIDFTRKRRNIAAALLTGIPIHGFALPGGSFLLNKRVVYHADEHVVDNNARLVDGKGSPPKLYLSTAEQRFPAAFIKKQNVSVRKLKIGLHVGYGKKPCKGWPLERYNELMQLLTVEFPVQFFLFGVAEERRFFQQLTGIYIDCTSLSLRQAAALMQNMNLFICNDSGPMHIAAAVGIPVLALLGPTDERQWAPYSPQATVVRKIRNGYCSVHDLDDNTCMQLITVREVFDIAKKKITPMLNLVNKANGTKSINERKTPKR